MRIGIDIDGVLTDIEEWQLEFGTKYLYENNYSIKVDNEAFFTDDIFKINIDLNDRLWAKGIYDYIEKPPRIHASEVIQKLRDYGNEIYIITARSGEMKYVEDINQPIMEQIVRDWLKKYNIYYDKLIFTPQDKVPTCLENKIDIMIEDSPNNINAISQHIPVVCFNAKYNEKCIKNNVTRCYTWYDILQKIKKN